MFRSSEAAASGGHLAVGPTIFLTARPIARAIGTEHRFRAVSNERYFVIRSCVCRITVSGASMQFTLFLSHERLSMPGQVRIPVATKIRHPQSLSKLVLQTFLLRQHKT